MASILEIVVHLAAVNYWVEQDGLYSRASDLRLSDTSSYLYLDERQMVGGSSGRRNIPRHCALYTNSLIRMMYRAWRSKPASIGKCRYGIGGRLWYGDRLICPVASPRHRCLVTFGGGVEGYVV